MLIKPIIESIKLLLISFIFIVNTISAQTYISPVLGFDFQKVFSTEPFRIRFYKEGYSHKNHFIGIKVEQKIYKSLLFTYMSKFAYNKINGYSPDGGFFQDFIFKYYYFDHSFGFGYLWRNRAYINIARSYSFVINMRIVDIKNGFDDLPPPNRINEKGLKISTGLKYRKFDLGIYYYLRTSPVEYDRSFNYYQSFKEISSLGFELSYNFKIINGIKWKKSGDCPDFKTKK